MIDPADVMAALRIVLLVALVCMLPRLYRWLRRAWVRLDAWHLRCTLDRILRVDPAHKDYPYYHLRLMACEDELSNRGLNT